MSEQQRRAVTQAAWRLSVLSVLTLAVAWDAAGLLTGGDAAYVSPSYDVLRRLVPGGMRGYGYALAVLLVLTIYALGRHAPGAGVRGYRLLRVSLALISAWYVLWAVGIAGAWVIRGQILAWDHLGKLALVAVLCVILARTTPADQSRG